MPLTRRILHHGPHPDGTPLIIENRAIRGCWFELHRQGGCGAGELRLIDSFPSRHNIEPGDWISCEGATGDRWYLGRVETCRAESPAGLRLQLEGMTVQLNEVFPGGFGSLADGAIPHRYAATDLFANDPDRLEETVDFAESVDDVVRLLLQQYVTPATHIHYVSSLIESPLQSAEVTSLKFRGEETVRTVIKDLAMRAQGASWGVNAQGEFYFLRPRDQLLQTYQETIDLVSLEETRDREYLYNRLLLTGDYVYDRREDSDNIARRAYRWRANFMQPDSRSRHGERRLRLWLPWIRTQADSRAFAREFFRTYANPQPRYRMETLPQPSILFPWEGRVAIRDRSGELLTTARMETVRVSLDHAPCFRIELGPEDPRELWPEPPQDERWEAPEQIHSMGGPISSLPIYQNSDGGSPASVIPPDSPGDLSLASSDHSSDHSSDVSSDWSCDESSHWSWTSTFDWPSGTYAVTGTATGTEIEASSGGSMGSPAESSLSEEFTSNPSGGSSVDLMTTSFILTSELTGGSLSTNSADDESSGTVPESSVASTSSGTPHEPSTNPMSSGVPPQSSVATASSGDDLAWSMMFKSSSGSDWNGFSSFVDAFSTSDDSNPASSGPHVPASSITPPVGSSEFDHSTNLDLDSSSPHWSSFEPLPPLDSSVWTSSFVPFWW